MFKASSGGVYRRPRAVAGGPRSILSSLLRDGNTVADYQAGVGITGTTNASAWANQIGAAGPLLQATGANQPTINADGSLTFDGIAHYMQATFTYAQPEEIWLVLSQLTWTQNDYIFDGSTANKGAFKQGLSSGGASPQVNLSSNGEVNAVGPDGNLTVNTKQVARLVINGASSSITIGANAATTGNAGANNMGGLTIGASGAPGNFSNIQVWEVIARNAASSAGVAAQIYSLLKSIYGTA